MGLNLGAEQHITDKLPFYGAALKDLSLPRRHDFGGRKNNRAEKQVSKAVVAEQLAALIEELPDDAAAFRAKLPAYQVTAIEYVTATPDAAAGREQADVADAGPPPA